MPGQPDIQALIAEAMTDVTGDGPLGPVVAKALRIARLLRDGPAIVRLSMEARTINDQARERIAAEVAPYFSSDDAMRAVWGECVEDYIALHTLPANRGEPERLAGMSVNEIESRIATLTPVMTPELVRASPESFGTLLGFREVLARIRNLLVEYLSRAESQLAFRERISDVFETHRAYVDSRLAAAAPAAEEQLAAAYSRRAANDAEARSHALTSCRRALKSLADALYPASVEPVVGLDGKDHEVTDDKFMNRLIQFASNRSRSLGAAERAVLLAQIPHLGQMLDGLNELASKGVHGSTTDAEVDHCIIQTYLLIGDLLRLAEQ